MKTFKHHRYNLIFGLISWSLTSCIGDIGNNSQATNIAAANSLANNLSLAQTQADTDQVQGYYQISMGSGYDAVTNTATSGQSCLLAPANLDNIYIQNPNAVITFDQSQDLGQLENALGVDVSTKFGGDRFNFAANAQFANAAKNNYYATNVIYLFKYAGLAKFRDGTLHQGDEALTPVARSIVHKDQIRFREMCGNEFVEQMDVGATLAVRYTLGFNSHSDQQKFNAKFNANLGLADIATSIQQAAAQSNVHVNFSLSALQLGGDAHRLNDIFGQKPDGGHFPYINCGSIDGTDSDACKKMSDAIISYAQSIPQQLKRSDGSLYLEKLYYSNPKHSSYSNLGIVVGAPDPSNRVLQAMQQLTQNFDDTVYHYNFVKHYLTSLRPYLDAPIQANLEQTERRLAKQISLVYLSPIYKLYNCYKGYVSENCLTIKHSIDDAVERLALRDIEVRLLDYLEHNSYTTRLLMFNGTSPDLTENYSLAEKCILAPVSYPDTGEYAVNCDGRWLDLVGINKLIILHNLINHTLEVSGLNYISNYTQEKPVIISYPNGDLNLNNYDPNYFKTEGITATALYDGNESASFITDFGVLALEQNDA